jgi:tetraacyldisaccharide-1-P 4'-kinase
MRDVVNAPYWKKGTGFWLLSPVLFWVSLVWAFVAWFRRRRGYAAFPVSGNSTGAFPRVICIGNVIVGGTGKSPLVRAVAQSYLNDGFFVGIVARGIGESPVVGAACSPVMKGIAEAGFFKVICQRDLSDENREHFEFLKMQCPGVAFVVFQGANRSAALRAFAALAAARGVEPNRAIVLLDDGLQHFAAPRHCNACVWDPELVAQSPAMCLPVGPYREGVGSLFRSLLAGFDVRLWSRCRPENLRSFSSSVAAALSRHKLSTDHTRDFIAVGEQCFFVAQPAEGSLSELPDGLPIFNNEKTVLCVSGLANGKRFVHELGNRFSAVVFEHVELADHAALSECAVERLRAAKSVVLSAKDYFRWCDHAAFQQSVENKPVVVVSVHVNLFSLDGVPVLPCQVFS